jgi:hypothetical protein
VWVCTHVGGGTSYVRGTVNWGWVCRGGWGGEEEMVGCFGFVGDRVGFDWSPVIECTHIEDTDTQAHAMDTPIICSKFKGRHSFIKHLLSNDALRLRSM